MHEVTVAEAIVERLKEHLGRRMSGLKAIYLRVGRLTCISAEALQFAFDAMAADGAVPRTRVEIEWIEPKAECEDCGADFRPDDRFVMICPHCASPRTRLVAGDELSLAAADVE